MDTSRNESRICEKGGQGIVLPQNPYEYTYPSSARGILYGIALAYCFLGVSIVADTFMGSIEAVTSRRRQVRLKSGRLVTVRVWNDTVANITLMALGSSAPEILLSVIELFKNDMYSGELGPSTIVGSAAFNLLVIVAICIVTIPNNETRKVRELNVLYITVAFFSLRIHLARVHHLRMYSRSCGFLGGACDVLLFPAPGGHFVDGRYGQVWKASEEAPDHVHRHAEWPSGT